MGRHHKKPSKEGAIVIRRPPYEVKAPYLEVLVILVGRHTNIEGAIFKDGGAIKLKGALFNIVRALMHLEGRHMK